MGVSGTTAKSAGNGARLPRPVARVERAYLWEPDRFSRPAPLQSGCEFLCGWFPSPV